MTFKMKGDLVLMFATFPLVFLFCCIPASCYVTGDKIGDREIRNATQPDWSDSSVPCEDYHKQPVQLQCQFVNDTEDCQIDEGFIDYLKFSICKFPPHLLPLALVFLAVWLLFLLVALGVTADNFFCPALTVISHTLKLSQNIAGVTFLAFGNGAPDIFSAVAAISASKNGDAGLAIGALFGAGIFVTTMVAGAIAFTRPFKMVERPFLRDVIFYLGAAFWTFKVLYVMRITFYEALGFIGLYVLYVAVVVIGRKVYQRQRRRSIELNNGTTSYDNQDQSTNVGDFSDMIGSVNTDATAEAASHSINASLANGLGATESLFAGVLLGGNDPKPHENTPLLQHHNIQDVDKREHPLREFFRSINPIDSDWKTMGSISQVYEIFKAPFVFLLIMTVPVVDYSEDKHNWNRILNSLHLLTSPLYCVMTVQVGMRPISGGFLVWHLVLCIGVVLASVVFFTSKYEKQPAYHPLFAYLGFVVAVIWIYSVANEIVNLLEMYGIVLQVSNAVLGLTVLAWGNSIGDMIADVTMAKQGFPKMALSACFGGPLFNMLLGIGISCVIATGGPGKDFQLNHKTVQYILAGGLAVSLIFSLFFMLVRKFQVGKLYGILLFIIYSVFLVFALLTDLGAIPL